MVAQEKPSTKRNATTKTLLAVAISVGLSAGLAPVAQADALDNLIEKLKEKGVITEDEYKEVIEVREGERAVTRQRRKEEAEKNTKVEERAKTEMVGNFNDGIRWESADKKNSIGLNGRIQLDYRNFSGDDNLIADTFDIRRAYLTVAGKFWEYYTFDLTGDFAALSGSNAATTTTTCTATGCTSATSNDLRQTSHLDVAWFNVGWWQSAQFRFGQFKMPFSLEEQTSSRFIDFQERSVMNAYVPAKERGAMVHGTPLTGLFYGVAVSTGQGKNNNENDRITDGTDYIGRVGVNIAEMVGQKNAVYHLAAAYSDGTLPVGAVPNARTEGRGLTYFSAGAFTGANVDRTRTGLEGAVAIGPVKLQAEYTRANYSGKSAGGVDFDRDIDAWYAGVNWAITGEPYAANYRNGAFGRIRPNNNFSPKGSGWGAWEVGLRYSNFDASDFLNTNAAGTGVLATGLTNEAKAYTVGLKWLPTPNTRFLLNYIQTKFDTPITVNSIKVDDEKAVTFRAQFDF
jgi:phosphate-selective porin OprO and OprP